MTLQILTELEINPISLSLLKTLTPYDASEIVFPLEGFELPVESSGSGIEMAISIALLEAMASISKERIVIIIDEPELHLHPKLQLKLVEHLKKISPATQILASTHSPIIFKNVFQSAGAKLQLTRKTGGTLLVQDAHKLGFGHLAWSPTWGEICYLAYDLPTPEFHDDLYCAIEDKLKTSASQRVSQDDVETWLIGQGQTKEIRWQNAAGAFQEETLMTYVRNRIHHPDNKQRPPYSPEQLKDSITRMAKLIRP